MRNRDHPKIIAPPTIIRHGTAVLSAAVLGCSLDTCSTCSLSSGIAEGEACRCSGADGGSRFFFSLDSFASSAASRRALALSRLRFSAVLRSISALACLSFFSTSLGGSPMSAAISAINLRNA